MKFFQAFNKPLERGKIMKQNKYKLLLRLIAITSLTAFSSNVLATSIINNSSQPVTISNGLVTGGATSTIQPGNSFDIPSTWGDSQHLYARILANNTPICVTQYGVSKLPTTENQQVTTELECTSYNGPTPTPTPIPSPTPVPSPSPSGVRIYGNGTWVYDAQFLDGPDGAAYTKAGLWSSNLNSYNIGARKLSKITQFFTYGGDLEMYCRGSGEADLSEACTSKNMLVNYYPPSFYNTNLTLAKLGDSGYSSSALYKLGADKVNSSTNAKVQIIPIVDGRFDNPASSDYLSAMNRMTQSEAQLLADNVARIYCADNLVSGVQFDLEPFDFSKFGQQYFYTQIAKDFAGQNKDSKGNDKFSCKNEDHPDGRSFSVFTFPSKVNQNLVQSLNSYNNGYVIYSLYDLPDNAPVGPVNSTANYYNLVLQEVNKAINSGAYFQLGIPAAASVHEYESFNGKATGYKQLDYVKAAIKAINDSGVRANPRFLGIAVWGWSKYMSYPPHSTNVYSPSHPPSDVLQYLQQNM